MQHDIYVAMVAAGGALTSAALGFVGGLAGHFVEQRHARNQWLRDKQAQLYERLVKEVVRVADRHIQDPTQQIELTNLKSLLYLFIRMYFASSVPYTARSQFHQRITKYKAALESSQLQNIENEQGELVNFLSDIARKPLEIPDAEFKL